MATLIDTATLQPVEIDDNDAPAAVLSGRYSMEAGKRVVLHRPDGEVVTIPTEEIHNAFRSGYTFSPTQTAARSEEVEERYGEIGGKLLSGAAGVARGLTVGLSDRVMRNLGVGADTLRTLEEGNPLTSTLGEIGGTIAPLVLTGGGSAGAQAAVRGAGALPRGIAALGAAAGKGAVKLAGAEGATSLLGRAGAKALELGASGVVEGAVYGAGQAVSEDALGRADLNAESLIANMGLGALVGGGAGVLLGGAGVVAGGGAKKAVGFASEKIAKLGSGSAKETLEDFASSERFRAAFGVNKRAFRLLDQKNLMEKADEVLKDLVKAGDTQESVFGKLQSKLDDVSEQHNALVTLADEATGTAPLQRLSPREVAARIEKEVLPGIKKVEQPGVYRDIKKYASELKKDKLGGLSFADARARRRAYQDNINWNVDPKPLSQARMQVAHIWNEMIDKKIEPVLKDLGYPNATGAYRQLRQQEGLLIEMTGHAKDRALGNQAVRSVSASDYGVGIGSAAIGAIATGGAALPAMALGAVGAGANKLARTYGPAIAASVASRLSRLQSIQKAARTIESRIDKAASKLASNTGRGVAATVAAPASVHVLFNTSFSSKKVAARDRRDAAKQRSKELSELMADPAKVADRIAVSLSGLDESAPTISGHAAVTATKALQFLHAKAPKRPPGVSTMQPLLDDWQPTEQEASRFERYVRAAIDPMSVVDGLADGTLTKEGAETLKELYPQLHRLTAQKLTEKLATAKKKLPYSDRVNLSLLLGVPLDNSMRPEALQRAQAVWQQKPQQGQGGGGQRLAGIDKLDLASTMRTSTQAREVTR